MGMIDRFIGLGSTVTAVGNAATGVAGILTPSATRRMELDEEAYAAAMAQHQAEFSARSFHWFDGVMNGLNRLPRPLLTLGTIGLFIYAMVEPVGFSARMQGLALVPEPLWWLMGAIVSFYFGAREAHYFRHRVWPGTTVRTRVAAAVDDGWRAPAPPVADDGGWRAPAPPVPTSEQAAAMAAGAAVIAEVEYRPGSGGESIDPAVPVSVLRPRDDFSDNAALRDWAATL